MSSGRGQRGVLLGLVTAVLYSFGWAVLCDLVVEYSVWRHSGTESFHEIFTYSFGWLLGSLIGWVLLLGLICLTNRYWLSLGLWLALALLIAGVNDVKMSIRSEPLYPGDLDFLLTPRFLLQMVAPWQVALGLAAMVGVVAACLWIGRCLGGVYPRIRRRDDPRRWRRLLPARALGVALAVGTVISAGHFNSPDGGVLRGLYEAKGVHWRVWDQAMNYHDIGFAGGFLYNLPTQAMAEPEGYSEAAMRELAARYAVGAREINAGRDVGALAKTNVVLVLSESFTDPTALKGFGLADDPIPFTRALMNQATSGEMLAQLYGGGTANMEFEALTGQSLALFLPQLNTPYQQLVAGMSSYPSAVSWLSRLGYRAVAVHPFLEGMYKRKEVYSTLGFDEFVHDTTMQAREKLSETGFISDASAFGEVAHQIESSSDPLLVNLVTMQNHVPVDGEYDDPIEVSGDPANKDAIGQYARGLLHSDEAMETFLDSLTDLDEPTVVVFYGDHQPGIYGDDVKDLNGEVTMRTTPYFVWSSAGGPATTHGLTSPTHFLPMAMDQIGAPIPPLYALLDDLQEQIPAMEQGQFVLADGRVVAEEELPASARSVLHDMRLVQYDLSIGQGYAADALWTVPDR